jgi:anaerobic dimethyl sulfoxide reductase subunit B (iron-sulfur subunit)
MTEKTKKPKQLGFFFNADRCVQCRACELACKAANNVELGPRWRMVIDIWEGVFPAVTRNFFSLSCLHCARPACLKACPANAIYKRAEDGLVLVDREKCTGCRECLAACPYDVPQFSADGIMQKCDYCTGIGQEPACTSVCPAEALFHGTLEELSRLPEAKGAVRLTGPTGPSILVKNRAGNNAIQTYFSKQSGVKK